MDIEKLVSDWVEKIRAEYEPSSIVLFGSALRDDEFVEEISDFDFCVLSDKKNRCFGDENINVIEKTKEEFRKGLEEGGLFELAVLNFGKTVYGEALSEMFDASDYRLTEKTYQLQEQSIINQFYRALNEYFSWGYFNYLINYVYHAIRECARYKIIRKEEKPVDGYHNILQKTDSDLAEKLSLAYDARKNWKDKEAGRELPKIIDENHPYGLYLKMAEDAVIETFEKIRNAKLPRINDLLSKADDVLTKEIQMGERVLVYICRENHLIHIGFRD
jgi:predicted nucleotidyltransferase